MPVLYSFDTEAQGTETTLGFRRPFVARPRLPHGIRYLHMDSDHPIFIKSVIPVFTKDWMNGRFITWDGSILHKGIDDVFALAPSDIDFLTGEHMRHLRNDPRAPASVRIDFERPFITPPKVVVFFNHLEFDRNHNWRVVTTATDIDVNGFTLNIETLSGTILHCAQTCWIAYPEDREHIFSTSVSTLDVRPVNQRQQEHSKEISFNSVEFFKKPSVFFALNYLDIDCNYNLRINAYVDCISTTRLVWHINSWGPSLLHAAGAAVIVFN
ncbi:hypothetical protein EDB83DRAFT_2520484 [Lactarius deliciosus]|nr:hypothetical protein EDB83DRAFT_2520484 [Lactarius deliciosus]